MRTARIVLIVVAGCSLAVVATPAWAQIGSVESRLKQLEDREQIAQLLIDYGRHLDSRNLAAYAALPPSLALRARLRMARQPGGNRLSGATSNSGAVAVGRLNWFRRRTRTTADAGPGPV